MADLDDGGQIKYPVETTRYGPYHWQAYKEVRSKWPIIGKPWLLTQLLKIIADHDDIHVMTWFI